MVFHNWRFFPLYRDSFRRTFPGSRTHLVTLSRAVNAHGDACSSQGTPILFVTLNHRLEPLGFPLGPEAVEQAVLNLGLHDQRVALERVQRNIAFFGGDPRKVCQGFLILLP